MRECTVKQIEHALSELNTLLHADAVKGCNFGECYKETIELSMGALEDKRESMLEEMRKNERNS